MNRFFLCLVLIFAVFSCAKDEDPENNLDDSFPKVDIIKSSSAKPGDVITITGSGFSSSESYIVKFNGIEGNIKEININSIKVEVPNEASTGDIILFHNGRTVNIGTIVIEKDIELINLLIFHSSENRLAKIDLSNGELKYIGNNISYGNNSRGAVFHSQNNEYIGFENDIFSTPNLVRVNIGSGEEMRISIPTTFLAKGADFSDLIIDRNHNIYIFHDSEEKLAKIDITNGNLTYIGNEISYGNNSRGAVFHSQNNEYIGFENETFGTPYLVKVNVETGETTKVSIPTSFLANGADFSDLAIDQNDNIYIFHDSEKKLAKVDISNGNLIYVGNNIEYGDNTRGAVFDSQNNEYIGFEKSTSESPFLVKINVESGKANYLKIPSSFLLNGSDFVDLCQ